MRETTGSVEKDFNGSTGSMNTARILAHYNETADTPDTVSRLRRFVLDLAVRGKLVAQDPDDEPASELLKRISSGKAQMVKQGKIRKPRTFTGRSKLSEPYAVPTTWCWVRLDAVGAIIGGGTPSTDDAENFAIPGTSIPWLTPSDLGGYLQPYISHGKREKNLSEKGLGKCSACLLPVGTVLFSSRAPIGYVAIAANPITTNQGFKSIVPYVSELSRYIALVMKAFAFEINANAPGTTFKEVSGKVVAGVPFPLPPLVEQQRIVAMVDELMCLCDRLESEYAAREMTRDLFAKASLTRLNSPDSDPTVFRDDAEFAINNLKAITTRSDQIGAIRQTILNLAVRGKLEAQDPIDEPASELLKCIDAEKVRLVDMGEIKTRKNRPRNHHRGVRFASPVGWNLATLGKLALKITDGTHKTPSYVKKGVPFVSVKDFSNGSPQS